MSIPDPTLLQAVGQSIKSAVPEGWRRITAHVTAAANMTSATLAVEVPDDVEQPRAALDTDGVLAVSQLRKSMHTDGAGTWYNATFIVDDAGHIEADFDYENAPFGGVADDDNPESEGDAEPELLILDQQMFPRAPDALPEWHPARESVE